MIKLVNEYGQTVSPSHVYKCDYKKDLDEIKNPDFGYVAYVIHGKDGGEVYMYDSTGN